MPKDVSPHRSKGRRQNKKRCKSLSATFFWLLSLIPPSSCQELNTGPFALGHIASPLLFFISRQDQVQAVFQLGILLPQPLRVLRLQAYTTKHGFKLPFQCLIYIYFFSNIFFFSIILMLIKFNPVCATKTFTKCKTHSLGWCQGGIFTGNKLGQSDLTYRLLTFILLTLLIQTCKCKHYFMYLVIIASYYFINVYSTIWSLVHILCL